MPGTIFSRQTMKTAIGKRHGARPAEIIQFDQAMFESKLDAMVREKVERIVNAMPDASGGRDRQRREIREKRRKKGVQGRPLRTEPDRQGRQTRAQGPQAEGRGLRVGRGRTLPQARGGRRGGADRHVPGRRVHQAGRRHQPIAVGRADALADALRQAQEGVRGHRLVAHEATGGRVPVRVRGRRVAQALLGRARGERQRPRRHRRQQGGAPGGHRRGRGHEGGRGQLRAVRQSEVVTFSWTSRPGGEPPYGEVQQGAA